VICVEAIGRHADAAPMETGNIPAAPIRARRSPPRLHRGEGQGGGTRSVGKFPFIGNGKAIALGEAEGFIKTVFDANTGELLGAHMVGAEVTELIQGYVIARQLETTEEQLMGTVFPHPTLSEMMHESVLTAYGRAIHF
jgi:dihydrolipoamide dehydrogenase